MVPLLCAIACGLAFALSLPPFDQAYLGWIALAPLFFAVSGRRPLESVGLGIVAGLVCAVFSARWHPDGTRLFWGYLPFLWITIVFSLSALAACRFRRHLLSLQWVTAVSCAGIFLEWISTWLPLPIHIGLSQYRNIPLIQIASITGIWGVSLLLWLTNAAIADALLQRRALTAPLGVCAGLVGAALGFGWTQTSHKTAAPEIQVAAIQDYSGDETNGLAPEPAFSADREEMTVAATGPTPARSSLSPPEGKGLRSVVPATTKTKEAHIHPARRTFAHVRKEYLGPRPAAETPPARLVVWSEECLGYGFDPVGDRDPTRALARERDTVIVAGFNDSARPKPHNCAGVVDSDGRTAGVFQKQHLYLSERETNMPGRQIPAVRTAIGKVGAEVCFDNCYTGVTRSLAASGAQIVAMPNYDPPTPRGVLHSLHSAFLPFRAVENHVPFVRSDSNGLSQIVDAHGRILAQGPLYQAAIVTARLPLGDGRGTFFTKTGDWLAWLCIEGFLWIALSPSFMRRTLKHEAV